MSVALTVAWTVPTLADDVSRLLPFPVGGGIAGPGGPLCIATGRTYPGFGEPNGDPSNCDSEPVRRYWQ